MNDEAPPPPPDWVNREPWFSDDLAKGEEQRWPNEADLKGTRDRNTVRLLRNAGLITVLLLWFFALTFILCLAVWLVHFLSPYGWLTGEQLSKIQSVIFSGSIGALVSAFAQKHFDR